MITIRKSQDRGYADHGWLKSYHSFSFAGYYDPAHMGWGNLRVINEDRIAPGTGFGTHGHRDMEIVTFILDGELSHKDSMGNGEAGAANAGVIRPGEIQRMSAGSGVLHSEYNHSDAPTHLLQIWMLPRSRGGAPGYEQATIPPASLDGRFALLAAPKDVDASALVDVNSDAKLYAARFNGAQTSELELPVGRLAYLHVARGQLRANGELLKAGDALQLVPQAGAQVKLSLSEGDQAEVLLFDLGQPQ